MTMASDDWYTEQARAQWAQLSAEKAQVLARIEDAKANGYSAASEVQELADVEAKRANLTMLHEQYRASQQAPAQPELSAEERYAKPIERMNYNDVYEMAATSKHGVDLESFRRGIAHVQRSKRGE
jgi:hypothetical protein